MCDGWAGRLRTLRWRCSTSPRRHVIPPASQGLATEKPSIRSSPSELCWNLTILFNGWRCWWADLDVSPSHHLRRRTDGCCWIWGRKWSTLHWIAEEERRTGRNEKGRGRGGIDLLCWLSTSTTPLWRLLIKEDPAAVPVGLVRRQFAVGYSAEAFQYSNPILRLTRHTTTVHRLGSLPSLSLKKKFCFSFSPGAFAGRQERDSKRISTTHRRTIFICTLQSVGVQNKMSLLMRRKRNTGLAQSAQLGRQWKEEDIKAEMTNARNCNPFWEKKPKR